MALPAYTFKGIYKEIQKYHGSSVQNYIVAARTAQGYDDWMKSTEEQRLDAVRRWQDIQLELLKEKQQVKHHKTPPPCRFLKTRHMSYDESETPAHGKKSQKKLTKTKKIDSADTASTPLRHAQTYPSLSSTASDPTDLEEAIQKSVAATSKGDPNQDALIEKAIRASVTELQQVSKKGNGDEATQGATPATFVGSVSHRDGPSEISELDSDDSGIDTDEDENIKIALASSKRLQSTGHRDEELTRALEASRRSHEEHEEGLAKQKREEEIVLDYVKRQSLAEEEYRKSIRDAQK